MATINIKRCFGRPILLNIIHIKNTHTMKKILIVALLLSGCATYKTTYETATVGGIELDRVPNEAKIRIGKHTTITEKGLKRTVENSAVKVEDGAIVVRYTDRIIVKYE